MWSQTLQSVLLYKVGKVGSCSYYQIYESLLCSLVFLLQATLECKNLPVL